MKLNKEYNAGFFKLSTKQVEEAEARFKRQLEISKKTSIEEIGNIIGDDVMITVAVEDKLALCSYKFEVIGIMFEKNKEVEYLFY